MQPGMRRAVGRRETEAATVLPPNLRTLGALSFTQNERAALQEWLGEAGWPPGALNIHTLEGYLVALLVWPVELPPGAWLPPIWGERGWKVPAKLAGPFLLEKFVALISAFLQELDNGLYTNPVPYAPVIAAPAAKRRGERPEGCSWAIGFLSALELHAHAQGLKYRSEAVKASAMAIARCASMPPCADTSADLARAVYALAAERTSRGPLDPLDFPSVKTSTPRRLRR
jgi:yecA family protein